MLTHIALHRHENICNRRAERQGKPTSIAQAWQNMLSMTLHPGAKRAAAGQHARSKPTQGEGGEEDRSLS